MRTGAHALADDDMTAGLADAVAEAAGVAMEACLCVRTTGLATDAAAAAGVVAATVFATHSRDGCRQPAHTEDTGAPIETDFVVETDGAGNRAEPDAACAETVAGTYMATDG